MKRDFASMADPVLAEIEQTVKSNKVVVFSKSWCPFCSETNVLLQSMGVSDLKVVEADHRSDEAKFMQTLKGYTSQGAVPQIFIGGELVKGSKLEVFEDAHVVSVVTYGRITGWSVLDTVEDVLFGVIDVTPVNERCFNVDGIGNVEAPLR